MNFLFFGGNDNFVRRAQIELSAIGHGLEIVSNTGINLVRWMQQYGMPDAVFFGQDTEFPNNEYLIPAMKKVREAYPELHLVYVSVLVMHDPKFAPIVDLGIPFYAIMQPDDEFAQLVALATTKWPGFNPGRGFTPAIVRNL